MQSCFSCFEWPTRDRNQQTRECHIHLVPLTFKLAYPLLLLSLSYPEEILKSSWSHPEVILKSSWNHPEIIQMSLSSRCHRHPDVIVIQMSSSPRSHPELIMKSSWSHLEVILKSSWSHPVVILKSSNCSRCHREDPTSEGNFGGQGKNKSAHGNRSASLWYKKIIKMDFNYFPNHLGINPEVILKSSWSHHEETWLFIFGVVWWCGYLPKRCVLAFLAPVGEPKKYIQCPIICFKIKDLLCLKNEPGESKDRQFEIIVSETKY